MIPAKPVFLSSVDLSKVSFSFWITDVRGCDNQLFDALFFIFFLVALAVIVIIFTEDVKMTVAIIYFSSS